ncbi:reverse transcriptase domain-containing protein [Tanacetum coccineum]
MDLKTKLEKTTKNHHASIQNLEAKFNKFVDKQSARPSGSLPSSTQPNLQGSSSKPYHPLQARNEHVNVIFTQIGKSYDAPTNPNNQQNDSETPVNLDTDIGASINLMSYSLYSKLSHETLKPTKMSVRLVDRSFQHPIGIAENMLVEVGSELGSELTFLAGSELDLASYRWLIFHKISNVLVPIPRPLMLDKTDFASWQQRIRLYCHGKENGVNIFKSIDEGPFQMGNFRETLAEGTAGALHLGPERPQFYSNT